MTRARSAAVAVLGLRVVSGIALVAGVSAALSAAVAVAVDA